MTRHNVGPGAMGALKNNPSGGLVVGVAEGPVGEPGGEGGLEVGGGAGDGVGADVGQNLGKVVQEGAEVTGVEGAEDGIDLRESCGEAGAGEEVEAGVVGIGPETLFVSRGQLEADFESQAGFCARRPRIVFVLEPKRKALLQFLLRGLKDAGGDVVETPVGGAEAEDGAELIYFHDEASPVAPGTDEPVETKGVFAGQGQRKAVRIAEVSVPGRGQQAGNLGRKVDDHIVRV